MYYIAAKLLDQTVTFGPGYNKLGHIHAQDVASALLSLTRVVLDGTAHAGAEGICRQTIAPIQLQIACLIVEANEVRLHH